MDRNRLDPLSIVGLVLAALAILGGQWLDGGALSSLVDPAAFLIVIGGTLAAVLVQTPPATFVRGMSLVRWVAVPPQIDDLKSIATLVDWARYVRSVGFLALEDRLGSVADTFTRSGLRMLIDGFDAERIRDALETEIGSYEKRMRAAARVWEAAGGYAPTIGILGAVLGLIHVMENLTDPSKLGAGIAVAFVATIYGVGTANLLYLPIAGKLRAHIDAEVAHRELLLDGLIGIANGENPRFVEARLMGRLP
ncbi:MAG: flagellar motor protein [Burkholderiales bacterium]